MLVRKPRGPAAMSGRVLIEPFNTSLGSDSDALWCRVGSLLQSQGDVWIGISDHAVSDEDLKKVDAQRYSDIDIPSNDFAWDILTHIAAVVRSGAANSPLHGIPVAHLYLGGYSQSGTETATYAMVFGANLAMFDGYFPAAHAASFTPLSSGTAWILPMEIAPIGPCRLPVIDVEPQSDVEGFRAQLSPDVEYVNPGGAWVRRDDADNTDDQYRLYEIAGAPHVARMPDCDGQSDFPTSAFVRAALLRLFRWAEDGITPPSAPRISLAQHDQISRACSDNVGNAVGGVRSPFVDSPLTRYEVHSGPGILCQLVGRETPLPVDALIHRYGDVEGYLTAFTRGLDAAITAGVFLAADRTELLAPQIDKAAAAFATPQHQGGISPCQ
jgi:Alpha/beta hydrolase domain